MRVSVTNDVALDSKAACARGGYTHDPAAVRMHAALGRTPRRRTALVSLGYAARVHCVTEAVAWFCQLKAVATHARAPQLIALGAGHDTMHWRVRDRTHAAARLRTFDLDLPSVARSKTDAVLSDGELLRACGAVNRAAASIIRDDGPVQHDDVSCCSSGAGHDPSEGRSAAAVLLDAEMYTVVAVDLTSVTAVHRALSELTSFDFDAPTIVLSECVLAYLPPVAADALVAWAAANLRGPACFVEHAPVDLDDGYGRQMDRHFGQFGTAVRHERASTQSQCFVDLGWRSASTTLLGAVFDGMKARERARLLQLEVFDEHEELWLALQHYSIVVATSFVCAVGPFDDTIQDDDDDDVRDQAREGSTVSDRDEGEGTTEDVTSDAAGASLTPPVVATPVTPTMLALYKHSIDLDAVDIRRWNAAVTTLGADIVCFGGYGGAKQTRCGDTRIIDSRSGECTTLTTDPDHSATVSCTMVAILSGNGTGDVSMLRFGGRASPAKPSNAVLRMSPENANWVDTPHSVRGAPPPSPRWRHTAVGLGGGRIFVYGGRNTDGHVADVAAVGLLMKDDVVWCEMLAGDGTAAGEPGPRHSHCAAHCGDDRIVVYGGISPRAEILGGLFCGTVVWCYEDNAADINEYENGDDVSDGGGDGGGRSAGDRGTLFCVPSVRVEWIELHTVPPLPPRFGHACAVVREHCVCVVGGVGTSPLQWPSQVFIIVSARLCQSFCCSTIDNRIRLKTVL